MIDLEGSLFPFVEFRRWFNSVNLVKKSGKQVHYRYTDLDFIPDCYHLLNQPIRQNKLFGIPRLPFSAIFQTQNPSNSFIFTHF